MNSSPNTRTCSISNTCVAESDCIPCTALRPSLLRFIQKQHPQLKDTDWTAKSTKNSTTFSTTTASACWRSSKSKPTCCGSW